MPVNAGCCQDPKGFYLTLSGVTPCSCVASGYGVSGIHSVLASAIDASILDTTYIAPVALAGSSLINGLRVATGGLQNVKLYTVSGCTNPPVFPGGTVLYDPTFTFLKLAAPFIVSSSVTLPKGHWLFRMTGSIVPSSGVIVPINAGAMGTFDLAIPSTSAQVLASLNNCFDSYPQLGNNPSPSTGGTLTVKTVYGSISLSASSASFTNAAGSGTVSFTSKGSPDSKWVSCPATGATPTMIGYAGTSTSGNANPTWLTLTGAVSGDGTGGGTQTIPFSVAANATGLARSAKIAINDKSFTVNQAA